MAIATHQQVSNPTVLNPSGFYMASITRSFRAVYDLVFRALIAASNVLSVGDQQLNLCGSGRAKEAQLHGVRTLAFPPTSFVVVELGSSDLINENWSLINLIAYSLDSQIQDQRRGLATNGCAWHPSIKKLQRMDSGNSRGRWVAWFTRPWSGLAWHFSARKMGGCRKPEGEDSGKSSAAERKCR